MRRHRYFVYILTNRYNHVLYTGVTNSIWHRVKQHREGHGSKFTSKYKVYKLVYVAEFQYINDAIAYEKKIKAGSRQKKLDLINEMNPQWVDLIERYQEFSA